MEVNKVYNEDCLIGLRKLPDNCIDCCVTSPPYYGLRDYGCDGQIGLEKSPTEYIDRLTEVFAEVFRVLKPEGTLWLNLGDSYAGSGKGAANYPESVVGTKQGSNRGCVGNRTGYKYITDCKDKDLIGIPWMAAFALRDRIGFYLRNDIIWAKPNAMPESVTDRLTKSHEYIFLMSKSSRYYFDHEAIQEVATGYDGRKDTMKHGTKKYIIPVMLHLERHFILCKWRTKRNVGIGVGKHVCLLGLLSPAIYQLLVIGVLETSAFYLVIHSNKVVLRTHHAVFRNLQNITEIEECLYVLLAEEITSSFSEVIVDTMNDKDIICCIYDCGRSANICLSDKRGCLARVGYENDVRLVLFLEVC